MINLIPPIAKRTVKSEYWLRVSTVAALTLSFATLGILALQAPTYVLVSSLNKALVAQFDSAQVEQEAFVALNNEITARNEFLTSMAIPKSEPLLFSELISLLDTIALGKVALTQFTMRTEEEKENPFLISTISIIGEAPKRADLLSFKEALEAHAQFDRVELPISNLAKENNITFSMEITLAKPN